MPLAPECQAFIDQLMPPGTPAINELPMLVPEIRQMVVAMSAAFAGPPTTGVRVEDRRVPGPVGDIPVRVYTPAGAGPHAGVVYLHGGGWVLGTLDAYDVVCAPLARDVPCVVVSVDYRLAPEHRFPAAADDCYAAVRYVAEHAAEFGIDPARLAVGGDSAGGNLTAVVTQMAREKGGPRLAFQLLVYPATDAAMDTPSYRENGQGYFLTADLMAWFWNHYVPDAATRANPRVSPLRAGDWRGLPPALVITAEYDPLRDEGEAYAARLKAAGVPVTLTRYAGMIHGFFGFPGAIARGKDAIAEAARALRMTLAR
jgi:acetyl esterase